MILAITALNAASNIPIAYISMMGLIFALCPTLKLAIEAKTSTKTKMGATDLSALINRSPNRLK